MKFNSNEAKTLVNIMNEEIERTAIIPALTTDKKSADYKKELSEYMNAKMNVYNCVGNTYDVDFGLFLPDILKLPNVIVDEKDSGIKVILTSFHGKKITTREDVKIAGVLYTKGELINNKLRCYVGETYLPYFYNGEGVPLLFLGENVEVSRDSIGFDLSKMEL